MQENVADIHGEMCGESVGQSKAGQSWKEWYHLLEQPALVSSLAGMSTLETVLSINVAHEDSKFTVMLSQGTGNKVTVLPV